MLPPSDLMTLRQLTMLAVSDFTQRRATEFGLKGWVKNTSDGKVGASRHPPGTTLKKTGRRRSPRR